MDTAAVVARIEALPDLYAVMSTGLLWLADPQTRVSLRRADVAQVVLPRPDGSSVNIPLDAAFARAEADPDEFNLSYLRKIVGMMLAEVVADVQELGYSLAAGDPAEFNVLRVLRNASAHGNKFEIRNPNAPTLRELTIDPSLHGQGPVLFDYASPSLVFDLFSAVKTKLLSP